MAYLTLNSHNLKKRLKRFPSWCLKTNSLKFIQGYWMTDRLYFEPLQGSNRGRFKENVSVLTELRDISYHSDL